MTIDTSELGIGADPDLSPSAIAAAQRAARKAATRC